MFMLNIFLIRIFCNEVLLEDTCWVVSQPLYDMIENQNQIFDIILENGLTFDELFVCYSYTKKWNEKIKEYMDRNLINNKLTFID